jgi:DNA-binding beta-propeller fold protein YncE
MRPFRFLRVALLTIAALTSATPAKTQEGERKPVTIEATIPRAGDFMSFGFDSLWMINGERLVRVNSADNSVIDIEVNGLTGQSRGIAIGEGAVWVSDVGGSTIYAVDPQTNKVVRAIKTAQLRGTEGSFGVGHGAVWVVISEDRNRVLGKYDTSTGAELAKIPLPSTSSGVVVDFGSVWVTGTENGELYRINPATNSIAAVITLRPRPRFLTSGEGAVWVLNQLDGTVQRIDGHSGNVLATIDARASGGGGDITAGGGYIWVTSFVLPVIQIDPTTNSVLGKYREPDEVHMGDAIRYGDGSLWVSGGSIFRIKPPE